MCKCCIFLKLNIYFKNFIQTHTQKEQYAMQNKISKGKHTTKKWNWFPNDSAQYAKNADFTEINKTSKHAYCLHCLSGASIDRSSTDGLPKLNRIKTPRTQYEQGQQKITAKNAKQHGKLLWKLQKSWQNHGVKSWAQRPSYDSASSIDNHQYMQWKVFVGEILLLRSIKI